MAPLDRSEATRSDGAALNTHLNEPTTLLVPVWRDMSFVTDALGPATLTMAEGGSLVDRGCEVVWLGSVGGCGCFAIDVSEIEDVQAERALANLGAFGDLRLLAATARARDLEVLLTARGILAWHREARFCGRCGAATRSRKGGWLRVCTRCEVEIFPRTDPAVMILVTRGDECVLARQPAFPEGMWSALAGFVEPGESVEAAVHRETLEEIGIAIDSARYFGSQPWPFPRSLMLGFVATANEQELTVDTAELEAARWVTREELAAPSGFFYPPAISLAHEMIGAFATGALSPGGG